MKIRVLDFETMGVDPEKDLPLEFAMITYDSVTRERKEIFSTLIHTPLYPAIPMEIQELTGITDEVIAAEGAMVPTDFLARVGLRLSLSEMFCAYNAPFDLAVLRAMNKRAGNKIEFKSPVFDAMVDLPWPRRLLRCRQLQHRALDLGLPMDARKKHRAMADVETVCDIFDLYDMEDVLSYHAVPWVYVAAIVPPPWKDEGRGRDAAKAAGFGWECAPGDDRKFEKRWVARHKFGGELGDLPFEVEVLT